MQPASLFTSEMSLEKVMGYVYIRIYREFFFISGLVCIEQTTL